MALSHEFDVPENLSPLGRRAAQTIRRVLAARGVRTSGGGRVFYAPVEWVERGERYGHHSELIVTYDGGDHVNFFRLSDHLPSYEVMRKALGEMGMYSEECTCWYAAVYPPLKG